MRSPFSVITPIRRKQADTVVALATYRGDCAEWLSQAITSILTQTFTDFILVVVIDGPIESGLQSIIDSASHKDERVAVIYSPVNEGLAASMNKAIDFVALLNPVFFFRMDADDIALPTRLEKQVNYLKTHKNVGVLGTNLVEVNEQGQHVGRRSMPSSHKKIVNILPRRCSLNHPTVAIRYELLIQRFRYDDSLQNTQDYFLWIEMAANGIVFRNLQEPLLEFRRVNDFFKRRGLSKSLNEFKARFFAMKMLRRFTITNLTYASLVLILRLMPSKVIKLAYKLDRKILEKLFKN